MACGGCSSDKTYTLQFVKKVAINGTVYSFEFKALEYFEWQEGDSVEVSVLRDDETISEHLVIVSLSEDKLVTFINRIGDDNDHWSQLEPGDLVEVSPPEGDFDLRRVDRPALLISNGVGIAAVRSLVTTFAKNQEGVIKLTQVNIDRSIQLFKDEFELLKEKITGFKSIYVTNRESLYQQVDYESQSLMTDSGYIPFFYVAGSNEFLLDVTVYLRSVGFAESDIITYGQASEDGCSGCSGGGCSGCSEK